MERALATKDFQEFLKEVYPDTALNIQQMAAVSRWLRKNGFQVVKELGGKTIHYDARKALPTYCPVKLKIVGSVETSPAVQLAPPPATVHKLPATYRSALAYIKDLHAAIELMAEEIEQLRSNETIQLPEPPAKVQRILKALNIEFPGKE